MAETTIQWTDHSINPIRARDPKTNAVGHYCEKIAPGCTNCYASNLQKRFQTPAFGAGQRRGQVEVFLDEAKLTEVYRRKKPTKYFWADMSDLFGDWVTSEWLAKCFTTMDNTTQHTHQVLTKRPDRIRANWPLMSSMRPVFPGAPGALGEPLKCVIEHAFRPNVWLGTSISDQLTANKAVPELLTCRLLAPVLFLSLEPLLGPVDLRTGIYSDVLSGRSKPVRLGECRGTSLDNIDWVIVGGESGRNARPCNPKWIRSIVEQCKSARVPCFVKQLGSNIVLRNDEVDDQFNNNDTGWPDPHVEHDIHGYQENYQGADCRVVLRDKKGGDPTEWPNDLRVRQFPNSGGSGPD